MPPTLRGGAKRKIDTVTTTRSPTLAKKAKITQGGQSTSNNKGQKTTKSNAKPTNKAQKNRSAPVPSSSSPVNSTNTTQEPHNAATKPTLRISPVDQWNLTSSESSSSSAPSSPEDAANPRVFQGTMKDADGRPHYVLKVTQVFHAVDWRGTGRKSGAGGFEPQDCIVGAEEPVSPKSIPGVKKVEFALQSRGDGSVFYGAVEGEVDPETMSPFYPGILRMYGQA
ncbi:hypothetical protein KC343_g388 [Hortaea werneckii]|nr:hypothetical protein KC352_g3182 [Hortaea werneckii]KAI7572779.1 hypothetical protein KC317_g455 [Hortaea werneckii]KAI7628011.1 hypothetical protein KC346_g440 [Hortaea werneckii]KAI7637989.1 hypothetical protein KC343_g388 [Hortaea werneckii]KAI7683610.1 hypothetical protein KC319_g377 [Hortaea werneckii]